MLGKSFSKAAFSFLLIILASNLVFVPVGFAARKDQAKYVFLFIGDGMATTQRTVAEMYLKSQSNQKLLMNTFPAQGLTTTYSNDKLITDSAAAGTAIALGIKTNVGYLGVDPDFKSVENLAEKAKRSGRKVGIISSVAIDDATPACFYAHQPDRKLSYEIDMDLAKSGFDFFGGGGLRDPQGNKTKDFQGDALELAKNNGYTIITDEKEFLAVSAETGKIIAYNKRLPDGQALPYAIDTKDTDINLVEFTAKAIEVLDNPQGFFLMVEGGKIDWACHANDAVSAIHDILVFDQALAEAYEFYLKHPKETLIVVTTDHGCGGLTFGFAATAYESYLDILKYQDISFQMFVDEVLKLFKDAHTGNKAEFSDMLPLIEKHFGLTTREDGPDKNLILVDHELKALEAAFVQSLAGFKAKEGNNIEYIHYGSYDPLAVEITQILNAKAGLGWTTYAHTGEPVTTSAIGPGSYMFNGFYDNTDIPKKIAVIMNVKEAKLVGAAK